MNVINITKELEMERIKWIVLNYNLPTEPSRHRVAVWRGLKKLGAVNIQQSMWILPNSDENYSALMKICKDIELNNGEALLMESVFFSEKHQERVVKLFNNMREEEYQEFVTECDKYLMEIDKEISREKFTFSELEEEEAELEKLLLWYSKIKLRDIFSSIGGIKAGEMVNRIKETYEGYSEMVYEREIKE